MMQAGKLNTRVTIERRTVAEDPMGGGAVTWVLLATLWANFRNVSGSEAIRNDAPVGVTKASARIRYREDIDPTCRLIHRGTTYNIESVLPDQVSREYCDLVCSTGANDG